MDIDPDIAAFDHEWKHGDRASAKEMAAIWVRDHFEAIAPDLTQYGIEGLVSLVSAYRKTGRESDRIIVDMWLLVQHPPQQISGILRMTPHGFDAAQVTLPTLQEN